MVRLTVTFPWLSDLESLTASESCCKHFNVSSHVFPNLAPRSYTAPPPLDVSWALDILAAPWGPAQRCLLLEDSNPPGSACLDWEPKSRLCPVPNWICFGCNRKGNLVALPGKGGHRGLITLKIVCPNLEGVVRSLLWKVQRGCDPLVNILLRLVMRQLGVSTINFLIPTSLGSVYLFVGSIPLTSPTWAARQLRSLLCILWGGTRTLSWGCSIVS